MEKRVHLPGYHVEWNGNTKKSEKQTKNEPVPERRQEVKIDEVQDESTHTAKIKRLPQQKEENAEVSIHKEVLPSSEKSLSSHDDDSFVAMNETPKSNTNSFENTRKTNEKILSKIEANASNGDSSALRVIGWVLIGLGLVFLFIVSLLIGLLLMIVGLVFVVTANVGE